MITCIINGKTAYPAANQSIKITYANQYVTDDGEYSYDITFPMAIVDNRRVFHNVSRFDVSKNTKKYDDCKLYVGGRMVLSGVGTIISVSDTEIKLQIVGGKSRVKYNARLDKQYVDEMDLGRAEHGDKTDRLQRVDAKDINQLLALCNIRDFYQISHTEPFVGVEGVYTYAPTKDETNDMTANLIFGSKGIRYIHNLAVQPNLIYILHRILNLAGYRVERDDFDKEPWNKIYIASAYKTDEFRHALPHWTIYTFLEEFRKLFNAKISFSETRRTVSIICNSELLNADIVEMVPLDEFSVDYDEDGSLNTIDTSNVEFNLGDSENRTEFETIPQKVLSYFEVYDHNGMTPNLDLGISKWDIKRKRTTIIKRLYADGSLQAYYVWKTDSEDESKGSWFQCGEFSPLLRDKESDDSITLNICPSAVTFTEQNFSVFTSWLNNTLGVKDDIRPRYMLSVTNDNETESKNMATDEDGYSYVTVEDAIDDDSNMDEGESDKACLPIYFMGDKLHDPTYPLPSDMISLLPESCICDDASGDHTMAWPIPITDDVHLDRVFNIAKGWSLSLVQRATYGLNAFHSKSVIDNKHCLEVKFKFDMIPEPSCQYIIHNKKFICSKIEMDIKNDQIEPIYTGYFYMLS